MRAIDTMKEEHRQIERVLVPFKTALDRIKKSRDAGLAETFLKFCDFFSAYADRFHHAKEEDTYFEELKKAGVVPEGGPLGVMYEDHEANRDLVQRMREDAAAIIQGDEGRIDALYRSGIAYYHNLRDHIRKEDEAVFGLAHTYLDEEQQARLDRAVEEVRQRFEEEGTLAQCERLFAELTR